MAKTTTLLDGRKNVRMTGKVYLRAICPIGLFFSLSLICGNQAYLYLSVAFIQMLKVSKSRGKPENNANVARPPLPLQSWLLDGFLQSTSPTSESWATSRSSSSA